MLSDKQMLLEHAGLCAAIASLMDGVEPNWSTLCLSRETRNRIADIVARTRETQVEHSP